MGRAKLKIQRLESFSNRQLTFSKRRLGLVKKAEEISVLCDIDIILLLFSPSGKPTFFSGGSSKLEEIVSRFSQLSPQERAKRKLEAFEALRKMFEKVDHDVDMREFFDTRIPSIEDMFNQLRILQDKIFGVHQRLSWWMYPDKIENMEHLSQMEHLVRGTLKNIHQKKKNFNKQQVIRLDWASQLQITMQLPQMMPREIQMSSWDPADECQQITWYNQPCFPCQRNVECNLPTYITNCSDVSEIERNGTIENNAKVDNMGHNAMNDGHNWVTYITNCSDVSEIERNGTIENNAKVDNMGHNAMNDGHNIGSLKFQPSEEHAEFSWNTDVTSSDLRNLDSKRDLILLAEQMNFLDSDQMNFLDSGFTYNDMQHTFNENTLFNQGYFQAFTIAFDISEIL